ncbi:hypothetical protein [Absidia glauca]|uniref:Uncharacterized protein n=1 Tax=Absidia glauca TaxID=4829 RepID=A0A163IQK4_ABSGL|nr:hypothetical protein [Absidia glauca]
MGTHQVLNSPMMNTMVELLYKRFAAHTQTTGQLLTIPETIPVGLHHLWFVLNSRVLSADPGSLVPICVAIMNIYDQYGEEEMKNLLVPENVKKRAGHNDRISPQEGPNFLNSYQVFFGVFQFNKFGIERQVKRMTMNGRLTLVYFSSLNELKTRHFTGRLMFYGHILTDGVSLNFVFSRLPPLTHYNLYAPDFSRHTNQGHFRIVGLDPGRRDIVATTGGVGDGIYSTRQVSTAEYRSISGVTKRQQQLENLQSTTMITELDGNIVPFSTFESN